MNARRTMANRAMMALLAGLLLSVLGGCQVPAYVASVIAGPEKIPAVYEPINRATVVFIDDPANRMPSRELANLLAGRVGEILVEHKVIDQVIPPIMVERLRAANPDFSKWAIDRVGQQVGAKQVLYILVQDCQITEDNLIYRPTLTMRVKMIDTDTGARLFPSAASISGADGYGVQHATTYRDMSGATASTRAILMRNLTEASAVRVAELFYKHRGPEPGDNLPDR